MLTNTLNCHRSECLSRAVDKIWRSKFSTVVTMVTKRRQRQELKFHLEKLTANNQPKQSLYCDSQTQNNKHIKTDFFTCVLYIATLLTHTFPLCNEFYRQCCGREWPSMVKWLWSEAFTPLQLLTDASQSSSVDHLPSSEFEFQLYCLLTVWPWTSCLIFLSSVS